MATLGANQLTLADHAKRLDPDGKVAKIVELLSQANEVLPDMVFLEANGIAGHQTTVRTGLPSVYWRLLNQGVQPSKSRTAQVTEGIGMLEAWSEVDVEMAKLANNVGAFRLSEASSFIEAMSQEMAQTLFYGNTSLASEEFHGLSIRYSSLSATNAKNIINAGGSQSDNSSIWLIVWGEQTVHGIFPKGSQAGLEHKDLGEQTVDNAGGVTGAKMRALQDQFIWKTGLALRDWRYAVRICNIDISTLIANSAPADLTFFMTKAIHRIPAFGMGKAAFYMNRTCIEFLDIQRQTAVKAGGGLTYSEVDGKNTLSFRGIPIRRCDALLETEATVS